MIRLKPWLVAVAVAAGVLLLFPPERYGFYPRCPFFEVFGLLCPGCGATRAAAALLHGHVGQAVRWNALFVAVLTLAAIFGLAGCIGGSRPRPRRWMLAAGMAVSLAFTVMRNVA